MTKQACAHKPMYRHAHVRVSSVYVSAHAHMCAFAQPTDRFFMELVIKFARKDKVKPVPLEKRSRQELLDLLDKTRSTMEQAEIIVAPFVVLCARFTGRGWGDLLWDR